MTDILPEGVYPPLPTFFDSQDELDLKTLQRHMRRLAYSGIAGYVLMGTNGEAVHLAPAERAQLIASARELIEQQSLSLPLIVGCGEQSTRTTIQNCRLAADCGAHYTLVLPPFYYRERMHMAALIAHYCTVADQSPLPLIIYNMPASAAGLDLDAATIIELAGHPNIIGVKDSSGNLTKLAQVVATVSPEFRVFAGNAGFFLPALSAGASGVVSALANIYPRAICQVQALFKQGRLAEAQTLQASMIPANAAVTTLYSVPGLKAALQTVAGYGGRPRLPLQLLNEQEYARLTSIFAAAGELAQALPEIPEI